jgi:hypothetical protein
MPAKQEIQIDGKKKCSRCNNNIKVFTKTKDWKGRKMHLECYNNQELEEWFNACNQKYETNFDYETIVNHKKK